MMNRTLCVYTSCHSLTTQSTTLATPQCAAVSHTYLPSPRRRRKLGPWRVISSIEASSVTVQQTNPGRPISKIQFRSRCSHVTPADRLCHAVPLGFELSAQHRATGPKEQTALFHEAQGGALGKHNNGRGPAHGSAERTQKHRVATSYGLPPWSHLLFTRVFVTVRVEPVLRLVDIAFVLFPRFCAIWSAEYTFSRKSKLWCA